MLCETDMNISYLLNGVYGEYKLDLNPNLKKKYIFLLMSNFTILPSVAFMPRNMEDRHAKALFHKTENMGNPGSVRIEI